MKKTAAVVQFSILLFIFPGSPVTAAENMLFRGTLIEAPPCTINDGGEVGVDFGKRVGVTKVDGTQYLQPVTYRITCDPGSGKGSMALAVIGIPADYDEAAIKSNMDDLAIRLLQNGKRFIINTSIPVNLNALPVLEAVPVKRPGSTLKEGAFVATATLLTVYQ